MSKMNKKARKGKRPNFGMLSVNAGIDNNPGVAYANMAASKYCKDPNYAKKSKKCCLLYTSPSPRD